jgi:hypothetical protein
MEIFPASQIEQELATAGDIHPEPQLWHMVELRSGLNRPAVQFWHTLAP